MKDEPLISVIVPVYNVELYLKRCVESITTQSYKNLEIILVDDGSTDGSAIICDELSQQDDRIRVFHQANKGLSGARNKGLDEMRGDWVLFVDSDDYISPDCVEVLYGLIDDNVPIASGNWLRTDNPNLNFSMIQKSKESTIITGRQAMEIIYGCGPRLFSIVAWGKLFSKTCFQELRFREGIIHEDEELMWKLLYRCKQVAVTQKVVYAYVMSANSIMRSDFSRRRLIYLDILAEREEFYRQAGETLLWELTQKTRCYILFQLSVQSRKGKSKDRQLSRKLRREFNALYPSVVRMASVDNKSKCVLWLMRFFPMAYSVLKR